MAYQQVFGPAVGSAVNYAYDGNPLAVSYNTVTATPDNALQVTAFGGNVGVVGLQANVVGGGVTGAFSVLQSSPLKFILGEQTRVRIAAAIGNGNNANTNCQVGIGDSHNGLFFGFTGNTFGVTARSGGAPELRQLALSASVANAGNVTLTLDGTPYSFAVTPADTATTVAQKIVAAKEDSWSTFNLGTSVLLQSQTTGPRTGVFSVAGSGVTGTFSNVAPGVAPVTTFVPQALWNVDRGNDLDNLSNINPAASQVYMIQFQNSGYGLVTYSMQSAYDGRFYPVHKLNLLNSTTVNPLLNTEALPLRVSVSNNGNVAAPMSVLVSSLQMDVYNPSPLDQLAGPRTTVAFSAAVYTVRKTVVNHFISILNNVVNPLTNRLSFVDCQLQSISISFDGPGTLLISVLKNASLSDPTLNNTPQITYNPINYVAASPKSVASVYTGTGPNVSGGTLLKYFGVPKSNTVQLDVQSLFMLANPGDLLTLGISCLEGSNMTGTDVSASLTFCEKQ